MRKSKLLLIALSLLLGTGLASAKTVQKEVTLTFADNATYGITWNAGTNTVSGQTLTFSGNWSASGWEFSQPLNVKGFKFASANRDTPLTFEVKDNSGTTGFVHYWGNDNLGETAFDLAEIENDPDMTAVKSIFFNPRDGGANTSVTFGTITLTIEVEEADEPSGGGTKTQVDLTSLEVFFNFGTTADLDATTKTVTCSDANTQFGVRNLTFAVADYDRLVVKATFIDEKPWNVNLRVDNGDDPYYQYTEAIGSDLNVEQTFTINLKNGISVNQEGKDASAITTIGRIYFFVMGTGKVQVNDIYLEKDATTPDTPDTPVTGSYKIAIDSEMAHGTVTASAETADAGTSVTFTATPAADYRLENLTVQVTTDAGVANARRRAQSDGVDVETATEVSMTYDPATGQYTGTYTMPASDIMVMASFVGKNNLAAGTISGIDAQYKRHLDGTAIEPVPVLTIGGETIDASNYTVTYANNTAVGTATVTLTAQPLSELYKGSVSANFVIVENYDLTLNTVDGLATFYCSDHAYTLPEGATAYTGTISGDEVLLTAIEGITILKGQAVIVKSDAATVFLQEDEANAETFSGTNDLKGTDEPLTVKSSDNIYVLKNGAFVWAVSGTLPANKAFIVYSNPASARRLTIRYDDNGATTGIETLDDLTNSPSDASVYDLCGRKLSNSQMKPGIYVVNGKKVFLK